jgi:hypothetical protein
MGPGIAFSPTHQSGVPEAKFSVTLPADATTLTYIHFELRSYTGDEDSSFRTLVVNNTCKTRKSTCTKQGSTVQVNVPLSFSIDWWTAGLLHPGTYHPYILVMTDSKTVGPATVELPNVTVSVRRKTRFQGFDAGPEPVRTGAKVTVVGQLQRAMSCVTQQPVGQCANGAFGYWSDYRNKKVRVYINPAGSAGPMYRKSLTTDGTGHFHGRLTAHSSGRWYVRFETNHKHKGKKSRRDGVKTT